MHVTRIRALRGPNLWSRHTAIEAVVSCPDDEIAVTDRPGFETRLRTLFPSLHPFFQSALNGLIFGAVHGTDIRIAVLTALGGTLWSVLYLRYRLLWPLAVSHALLGATFYYWVYGYDLASRWSVLLVNLLNQR